MNGSRQSAQAGGKQPVRLQRLRRRRRPAHWSKSQARRGRANESWSAREAGRARGKDRRREPESQPLVIRRCNGRRMRDTHRRLSWRCKVRLKSKVHHKPVRGIQRRKPRGSNRKPKEPACDEIPGRTTVEPGSWSPAQAGRPTKTRLKDSGNGSRREAGNRRKPEMR